MADQPKQQPGMKLPTPGGSDTPAREAPQTGGGAPATTATTEAPPPIDTTDTSARDMAIGLALLVVAVIGFVFAKNAYTIWLVGKKVAPRSANAAGWWLFLLLTIVAAALIMAIFNPARLLTILVMVPLVVIALILAVLLIMSSRR